VSSARVLSLFWIALDLVARPMWKEIVVGMKTLPPLQPLVGCSTCANYRIRLRRSRRRGPFDRYDPPKNVVAAHGAHVRRVHRPTQKPILAKEPTGPSQMATVLVARSFGLTVAHIGKALGLTKQRIYQIEATGHRRFQHSTLRQRVAKKVQDA